MNPKFVNYILELMDFYAIPNCYIDGNLREVLHGSELDITGAGAMVNLFGEDLSYWIRLWRELGEK